MPWYGGDKVIPFDDEPERAWRVDWNLNVVRVPDDAQTQQVIAASDVYVFRVAFETEAEALAFRAELQRYRGHLLGNLATELKALFDGY